MYREEEVKSLLCHRHDWDEKLGAYHYSGFVEMTFGALRLRADNARPKRGFYRCDGSESGTMPRFASHLNTVRTVQAN